jgi:type II secretory pathway pseudopilin PulG
VSVIRNPVVQARRRRAERPHAHAPTPGAVACARPTARRAYTYVELLVTLGILAALTGLLLPLMGKGRASAQSVACLSHLRQVGSAFLQYAADNDKVLPDPFNAQVSWEQLLRPYLPGAEVYRCAADSELYPSIGSSYDWRDTGRADTTLAGKAIDDTPLRPNPVLAFEALPGWHARAKINVVMLSGSAYSMGEEDYLADVQEPLRYPILMPKAPPKANNRGP